MQHITVLNSVIILQLQYVITCVTKITKVITSDYLPDVQIILCYLHVRQNKKKKKDKQCIFLLELFATICWFQYVCMEEENGGANWRWTLPLFVLQGQDCYGMVLLASSVFISSYIALKSPWTDFQLLCVVGFVFINKILCMSFLG